MISNSFSQFLFEQMYKTAEKVRRMEENMITGKITMANKEVIPFELYEEDAPITVANFVKLIKEDYYNGKTFHSRFCFSRRLPVWQRYRRFRIYDSLRNCE